MTHHTQSASKTLAAAHRARVAAILAARVASVPAGRPAGMTETQSRQRATAQLRDAGVIR